MAKRVKKTGYEGGFEASLLIAGYVLGLLFLAALIFFALTLEEFNLSWLIIFSFLFFQGIMSILVFKWAAYVIALLKKIAGMPYGINITPPREVQFDCCSDCGTQLPGSALQKCPSCGAVLENETGRAGTVPKSEQKST